MHYSINTLTIASTMVLLHSVHKSRFGEPILQLVCTVPKLAYLEDVFLNRPGEQFKNEYCVCIENSLKTGAKKPQPEFDILGLGSPQ